MPAPCPQAVSHGNPLSSESTGDSCWLIASGHWQGWKPRCFWVRPLAAVVWVAEPSLCSRGIRAGPWSVRRMAWPTCMASSAGVTAVGGSISRESTPVCPIMWTGSMTAYDHPRDPQLPPELPHPTPPEELLKMPFLLPTIKMFPRIWLHGGSASS